MITIEEYRKILNDNKSTDEHVKQRLSFLEAFCRNVIRSELEIYVRRNKTTEQNQSGGVKTPEGKAISRYNAQKHAILRNTITEYEEADAAEVYNDLIDDLKPEGRLQEIIVEAIASNVIRLQRIAKAETELIKETLTPSYAGEIYFKEYTARVPVTVAEKLLLYSRYQTSTENRIYRAIGVLKQFNLHEQQT